MRGISIVAFKTMASSVLTTALLTTGAALAAPQSGVAQDTECQCDAERRFGPQVRIMGPEGLRSFRFGGPRVRIGVSLGGDAASDRGARVVDVEPGGPADRAGVEPGDLIVSVDGHDLMDPLDGSTERRLDEDDHLPTARLLALAEDWEEGESVRVEIERDGSTLTLEMEPEEMGFGTAFLETWPDAEGFGERMRELAPQLRRGLEGLRWRGSDEDAPQVFQYDGDGPRVFQFDGDGLSFGYGGAQGLRLTPLNQALGRYFGVEEGVLVTDVAEESELGLEAGDVILEIGGRAVDEPQDVRRILRSYDQDETVSLRVRRDGRNISVEGSVR